MSSFKRFFILTLTSLSILLPLSTSVFAGNFESGFAAYREKDYSMAIPLLRQAVNDNPNNPNIRYYLADALLKNNRLGEAQAEYNQIIALAPGTQSARLAQEALANMKAFAFNTNHGLQVSSGGLAERTADKLLGVTAGDDTYIDDVSNSGKYVRWSLLKPIKIYIEKAPKNISHFQSGFISTIPRAISTWNRALGGQLQTLMVSSPEQADIRFEWVNTIDHHGFVKENIISYTAGLTTPNIEGEQLKTMRIQVATIDIQKKPQDQASIEKTVIHELGHALGLMGHSEIANDLMFVQNVDQNSLSQRDVNTIRKLYIMDADITNLPPDPNKKNAPGHDAQVLAAIDKSIQKYETQAKVFGNALSWLNLGVNYAKKAIELTNMQKKSPNPAPQMQPALWNNKAIAAYTKSIELEPQNSWALTRRATVYQQLNQLDKAYADAAKAIKIAPKEPDLHLQMADILASMGKKPDAQIELNTFKSLAPNGTSSNVYKKIAAKVSQ